MIAGDINIDILSKDGSASETLHAFNSYDFLPLINIPTRVCDITATCLDHMWYNHFDANISGVFVNDITDHFITIASLRNNFEHNTCEISFRNHSEANMNAIRETMYIDVYFNCGGGIGFDERCEKFIDAFYTLYDSCCPIKTKNLSIKKMSKPWISSALWNSINRKHQLFKQYRAGNIRFIEYNNFKNTLTNALRVAKRDFYINRFNAAKGKIKDTWRLIDQFIRGNKNASNISLIDEHGSEQSNPKDVSNIFSNYISSVAEEIDKDIPPSVIDPLNYLGDRNVNSFCALPATPAEVRDIIMSFPNKKCKTDSIPTA